MPGSSHLFEVLNHRLSNKYLLGDHPYDPSRVLKTSIRFDRIRLRTNIAGSNFVRGVHLASSASVMHQGFDGCAAGTLYDALIYELLGWNQGRLALAIKGIQASLQLCIILVSTLTVDQF